MYSLILSLDQNQILYIGFELTYSTFPFACYSEVYYGSIWYFTTVST